MIPRPPTSTLFPYTTLFRSWIGGSGPKRTLRVVARHADVWNGGGEGPDETKELLRILDEHCVKVGREDRKSTRLNSSHSSISYAVFCLKKKTKQIDRIITIS